MLLCDFNSMWHYVVEPFSHAFMRWALLAVVLSSVSCGLVGSYAVLRRWTFLTHALAHTILPGLVVAVVFDFSPLLGAVAAALATVGVIAWCWANGRRVRRDTAIGVANVAFFALGVVLMYKLGCVRDLNALFLGNVLSVDVTSIVVLAAILTVNGAVLFIFHKELELVACDPEYAQIIGICPRCLDVALLILLALSIVSGVQVMGTLLVAAAIVVPAATASLSASSLGKNMLYACGCALVAGVGGLYISYYADIPAGASMVLVAGGMFVAVRALA